MARPPDLPLSFMGTLIFSLLGFLSISIFIPDVVSAQTTNATSWTFNEPGVSRITFSPPLNGSKILRLEMSFRTLKASGTLLYVDTPDSGEDGEFSAVLDAFHLFVAVQQRHLRVGHMFGDYRDIVNIESDLNDDQWHTLAIIMNQTSGELRVRLDTNSVTELLKAYIWGDAREVLDWSRTPLSVKLGGRGAVTSQSDAFVGCLRDLKYSVGSAILQEIPVGRREGVTPGCIDRCQGEGRCKNNGRCVNRYIDFHCDCFGTDYEGQTCETQGASVLTFRGYEWVTYQVYQGEDNRPFSDKNRISLEFKTERPSGILLYAVGGSPYHNHITAALHSGVLHVSVAFGNDDLDFPIGIGLDDNRWHNLTIIHNGQRVDVYLDGDMTSRSVKNGNFYLSLDPLAYIGGGDNFVITRGLPVTRNFVGCMKNVYFNEHSILYMLTNSSDICVYHGGESPTFGCSPVQDIPISFPNAASVLRWSLGSRGENLTVDFQFRTVREDSILFYVELQSKRDNGGWDYGLIEVWLIKGRPVLMFVPSMRNNHFSENITLPVVVNDQHWHSMLIELQLSQAKLKVDAVSRSTMQFNRLLNHKEQVILGFGLRGYKQSEGYVGCMEQIVIQGKKLDPIMVVESNSAIGLKLDGCYLVDYCSLNNFCEHESKCLPDWDGVQCECQGNNYEGKACHFPQYPATCDAYYRAGHTESGVYRIDVDGSGSQDPVYVECSMGSERNGQLYGATMVEHNFALAMPVRGRLFEDRLYQLTYRELNRIQLMTLGGASESCEQFFKYTCHQSPILLGKKTWFKSASGQMVDYLGAARSGFCTCPESDDGTCGGLRCFCDHNEEQPTEDEGYSHSIDQLPIMEMTFLQDKTSAGSANMTLGPLTCWGSNVQHLGNLVTLTTPESYLKLDTWTRGDMSFHFKTYHDHALLLMQTSNDTVFGNKLVIKILSARTVGFYFQLNGTSIREVLRIARPVNEGNWNYILIEHDLHNIRISLNTTRRLVSLNKAINGVVNYDGVLYLGGLPDNVARDYKERTPGFSGCIQAFLYNGKEVELDRVIDSSMSGVSAGCKSSCWPNPCEHGGTCKEDWGEYTCHCQDPWAHQGRNCEHNLNIDAVTFDGETSSFLSFELTNLTNLDQTIVLSFRTSQTDALLLYAFDHLSNFIQMELQQGNTIVFTYNSQRSIVRGSIVSPEPLNDGEWKQVVAEEYYNLTRLIYGDKSEMIEVKRIKLNTYYIDPFKDSVQKESVFIPRTFQQPDPFLRMYVAGVGEGGTPIPFLKGCVRGMRIGNYHINLADGVKARGNSSGLTAACNRGCNANTCLNGGFCNEMWQYGNFTCDCSFSDFSGPRCEKEASVLLDGRSVVEHSFTLPVSAQRSVTEQFTLKFRTTGSKEINDQGERMDMALIYIKSTENEDYILAKINSEGSVLIETNQGLAIYGMKISGNFANGELHELAYKREGPNMYLTLDNVEEASNFYPEHDLDQIDTIIIGGLLMGDDFDNTANFTGCISNPVFVPEANLDLKIRTLKELHHDELKIMIHGPDVQTCSEAMLTGKMVTDVPYTEEITSKTFEMLTMPGWDVGPAHMVTLSPPRVLTTSYVSTDSTTSTTSSGSRAMIAQDKKASVNDLAIAIAISVIALILIIAVIIALLIFRRRRRRYEGKKDVDIELKQPLNYQSLAPVHSSPPPSDHLAKLDEFSTISATLGPKSTTNSISSNDLETDRRPSQASKKRVEEGSMFEHPIFSRKKQRPASSISEVLEELERQNFQNNAGSSERIVGRPHGEGDLEWDPQADRTPLTYEDITFFNTPLLAPIPDENEDSHVSSLSEQNSIFKEKLENTSPSADDSQELHTSLLEGNGDSGYEAESRPEITEDDATASVDEEGLDDENATDPKLYMYISNIDSEDPPVFTSPSRQRLLRRDSKDT